MNFPKHIQDAPTPRTLKLVSDGWSGDAACVSGDDYEQLERQLIWAEEKLSEMEAELKDLRLSYVSYGGETILARISMRLSALNEYKQGTKV